MNKIETYYVLKRRGKLGIITVYQYDRINRKIVSEIDFTDIMGYFRENITSFWNLLSEDQKYKSIIVPASAVMEENDERMPKAIKCLMQGRLNLHMEIYNEIWDNLRNKSIKSEWFEQYSNGEAIRK